MKNHVYIGVKLQCFLSDNEVILQRRLYITKNVLLMFTKRLY